MSKTKKKASKKSMKKSMKKSTKKSMKKSYKKGMKTAMPTKKRNKPKKEPQFVMPGGTTPVDTDAIDLQLKRNDMAVKRLKKTMEEMDDMIWKNENSLNHAYHDVCELKRFEGSITALNNRLTAILNTFTAAFLTFESQEMLNYYEQSLDPAAAKPVK